MHRLLFEECDERLRAGWHVDLDDCCDYASGQRKRYLRSEKERALSRNESPTKSPQKSSQRRTLSLPLDLLGGFVIPSRLD